MTAGCLSLDIQPQRRLAAPLVRREPELILTQHLGTNEPRYALPGRKAKTVPALKVPCGEGGVGGVADFPRNGFRERNQR